MGLLRFILAAAVIAGHSTGFPGMRMVDSHLAVTIFFIISAFYMSLILDSKYRNHYRLFITNRFIRLAPTYYLVLAISVLLYLGISIATHAPHDRLVYWLDAFRHHQWSTLLLMTVVQLTILGLELPGLVFYSPDGGLNFLSSPGAIIGWRFLFVPQAWTISLEFAFYLIAPFLVRLSTKMLILVALISLLISGCLRYFLYHGDGGAFTYQFLPPQLYLFILGILAYRYSGLERQFIPPWAGKVITIVFVIALLFGNVVYDTLMEIPIYAMGIIAIPFLFNWTRSNLWDRWIGELSYPMYMVHILISWPLHGVHGVHGEPVNGPLLLGLTVLASMALREWVEKPVDRWRQARVRRVEATETRS